MISNSTKEMVWTLHEMEKCPKKEIARRLGISRQSVYEILKDETNKNKHLNDTVKKYQEEYTESLLNGLQNDSRTKQIIDKILHIANDPEVLSAELAKPNGFRNLMGALKIIVDTNNTAVKFNIEERRTKVQENTLELKQKELELRTTNPEVFATPIIINDSDQAAQWYKDNGLDKPYSEN